MYAYLSVIAVCGAAGWLASEVYRGTRTGFKVYLAWKFAGSYLTTGRSPLEGDDREVEHDDNHVVDVTCYLDEVEVSGALDKFRRVWNVHYDDSRLQSVSVDDLCAHMVPSANKFKRAFLSLTYETNGVQYQITYESEPPNNKITFPVYPVASPFIHRTDGIMHQPHGRITSARLISPSLNCLQDVTTTVVMLAGPRGNFYTDTPNINVRGDWIRYELGEGADAQDAILFLNDASGKRYMYKLHDLLTMRWPLDKKEHLVHAIQAAPPPDGL